MPTLSIGPRDRVLAVGKTGSGKSTLLRTLAEKLPYRIILDTKQDPDDKWHGRHVRSLAEVKKYWTKGPVVYQPTADEMTPEAFETFFKWVYETVQDVTTVVDEAVTPGILSTTNSSRYADLLLRQGRGRRQPLWMGSQRPMWLKNEAISEADWIFAFHLTLKGDREKLAGTTDDMRVLQARPLDHSAWVVHDGKLYVMPAIKRRRMPDVEHTVRMEHPEPRDRASTQTGVN